MTAQTDAGLVAARERGCLVVEELGLCGVEDLDLFVICMAMGLYVELGPINGADAWIVGSGDMAIARVRESIAYEGQRRFAIAHELGHWCLHPSVNQFHVDTAEQLSDHKKDPIEIEANAFAAEVLMPERLFRSRLCPSATGMEQVLEAANTFRVGPTAAAKRFVRLTGQDCQLVAHRDGLSCWFDRSPGTTLPPIKPGFRVPEAVGNASEHQPFCRVVPRSDWFLDAEEEGLLREETFLVAESPALTLLTPIGDGAKR